MELYKNREWLYEQRVVKGKTYDEIAEEVGSSFRTIFIWCKKFNIRKKDKWELLNEEYGEYICEKYQNKDVLIQDLVKELRVNPYLITKVLNHNNIKLKDIHTIAKESNYRSRFKQRTYNLNYDYFKNWSHNMSYFLGFIYADGYIFDNNLRINLQLRDKELLEKFCEELEYDWKVVEYKSSVNGKEYDSCYFDVCSLDVASDLKKLGLYRNKSLTITFPDFIPKEYEIDFIRGYFDGDGSIEVKRQVHKTKNSDTYQLRSRFSSGSFDFLNGTLETLQSYGLKSKNIAKYKNKSVMDITYSTNESIKLYELFYINPNSLYLPRKKEKFELGIKLRNEKKGSI